MDPTANSGALGAQSSSNGPRQFSSLSTHHSSGSSHEALEKGIGASENHFRGPQKPKSQANPMGPNPGVVYAPNSPLRDDTNDVKNINWENHQALTSKWQYGRQAEGTADRSSANVLNIAAEAVPRTTASTHEQHQSPFHKPMAPFGEQAPPSAPRNQFTQDGFVPCVEQNQNGGRTGNGKQGYTNSDTSQSMSESRDLLQSQRPEPVGECMGPKSSTVMCIGTNSREKNENNYECSVFWNTWCLSCAHGKGYNAIYFLCRNERVHDTHVHC